MAAVGPVPVFASGGAARPAPIPQNLGFAQSHFFRACAARDAFGSISRVVYDTPSLLVKEAEDAGGNQMSAVNDYRLLRSSEVTDPNGNRSAVLFDILGFVAASAVMGKSSETLGDNLTGVSAVLTAAQKAAFLKDPIATGPILLGNATIRIVYDLERYQRSGLPVVAATSRERRTQAIWLPERLRRSISRSPTATGSGAPRRARSAPSMVLRLCAGRRIRPIPTALASSLWPEERRWLERRRRDG